jgi:hypothetical protein
MIGPLNPNGKTSQVRRVFSQLQTEFFSFKSRKFRPWVIFEMLAAPDVSKVLVQQSKHTQLPFSLKWSLGIFSGFQEEGAG